MKLQGIAASPGYVMGIAQLNLQGNIQIPQAYIAPDEASNESQRLLTAVDAVSRELAALRTGLIADGKEDAADILHIQSLLLEDEEFIGQAANQITTNLFSAEYALHKLTLEFTEGISSLDDPYLRERSSDIRDVSQRIMLKLQGSDADKKQSYSQSPFIRIAQELTPSDVAQIDSTIITGIVAALGGRTSHAAIIARSIGIPTVVGVGQSLIDTIRDGDLVIIDGIDGVVWVNPDDERISHYEHQRLQYDGQSDHYNTFRNKRSLSLDGVPLTISANISFAGEAGLARAAGAEGIGLFRTEFLYLDRIPTELEQMESYRQASQLLGCDTPLVIRTADIGGDKDIPSLRRDQKIEANPLMGYRAIRFSLDRTDLFKTQLRAILRTSSHGSIKLMFPMIAVMKEWRQAKALLEEVKAELNSEGIPYDADLQLGIMIETPAAAFMIDKFAQEVDFFSIGTNDLVQYIMAADRLSPRLDYLNDPLHPAVLRLIDHIVKAAHSHGKKVCLCGEMASLKHAMPILLGIGIDELSMNSQAILPARALLASLSAEQMREIVDSVLMLEDAAEVRSYIEQHLPTVGHD
ncbi:MAG: phosphoenolpyruvate--protein phosphotransferase [Candidatus Pristimantibacillus sp.]